MTTAPCWAHKPQKLYNMTKIFSLGVTIVTSALSGGFERTVGAVRYGFRHIRYGKFS